jgi:hypothetical protein
VVPLVPRFLANERPAVFVCDWAPLAGHSHQTSPRGFQKFQDSLPLCPSTSTLAKKSLNLQRSATTMDPRTQAHKAHQRQGSGLRARRHLVPCACACACACAFLSWGGPVPREGSQVPNFLGFGELAPIGQVWPRTKVKANPGCTGQPGSCAPEEEFLNPFQKKCLRAYPSSLEKYISSDPGTSSQRPPAQHCVSRYLPILSSTVTVSGQPRPHTPRQRERAHSHPVPASVSA